MVTTNIYISCYITQCAFIHTNKHFAFYSQRTNTLLEFRTATERFTIAKIKKLNEITNLDIRWSKFYLHKYVLILHSLAMIFLYVNSQFEIENSHEFSSP